MSQVQLNKSQSILDSAFKTIDIEVETLQHLKSAINNDFCTLVVRILDIKGRVIVTGIGKSFIIGKKIAATLNSTGTKAIVLHAADAIHGDIGIIDKEDLILIISKSGETEEIKNLLKLIKENPIAAIVGQKESTLGKAADYVLHTPVEKEACPNGLAPTSSTTAQLVIGDALAVALLEERGFSSEEFAKNHPGGTLGKRLHLRVDDLIDLETTPTNSLTDSIQEVLSTMSRGRKGCTIITNTENEALGIITDGDIRRMLEAAKPIDQLKASDIMSVEPKYVEQGALALKALHLMQDNKVSQIIVKLNGRLAGIIHIQDLIKEGLA